MSDKLNIVRAVFSTLSSAFLLYFTVSACHKFSYFYSFVGLVHLH